MRWEYPRWCHFLVFFTSGITWGCASGVASLIMPIFIFGVFLLLGAPVENLLGWICIGFFAGLTCWSPSGYESSIGNLGGSA